MYNISIVYIYIIYIYIYIYIIRGTGKQLWPRRRQGRWHVPGTHCSMRRALRWANSATTWNESTFAQNIQNKSQTNTTSWWHLDQNLWQFRQITLVLWDCVELATMELQGEECVDNSLNSKVPVTQGVVWWSKFGESLAWSLPNPIWPNPFSVHKNTCLRVANKQSTTKSRSSHSRTQTFKTTTRHHPTDMK